MDDLRVGIIGLGHIGTAHANTLCKKRISGAKLGAICDISEKRLDFAKEAYPDVRRFSDWRELIDGKCCDAVIVSVPHNLHAIISSYALENGIHTLSEKPQDVSVSMAKKVNATADKANRVYAIMFNQRTDPLFIKLREIIRSGELGEIKSSNWIITNWYRTQYYYDEGSWRATWSGECGGVLLNQAVHNLDLWQWICGMPCEITAFCDTARYHDIEVEDAATIFARYQNGATGTFITSTGEFPGTNRLEIAGTMGKAVVENGALKIWRLKEDERSLRINVKKQSPDADIEYSEFIPNNKGSAHAGVLQAFVDAISKGTPLIADGREGINELMISNAAYLSQWLGNKPVSLPIDEELFDRLLAQKAESSKPKDTDEKNIKGSYSERWSVRW